MIRIEHRDEWAVLEWKAGPAKSLNVSHRVLFAIPIYAAALTLATAEKLETLTVLALPTADDWGSGVGVILPAGWPISQAISATVEIVSRGGFITKAAAQAARREIDMLRQAKAHDVRF
jgi:hypothetical protein